MNHYATLAKLSFFALLLPLAACEELVAPELAADSESVAVSTEATPSVRTDDWGPALPAGWTNEVFLHLGEAAMLPGGRSLIFDAVGPDSRCPLGLDCPWEGEVEALFTLHTTQGTFPFAMTLPGGSPDALPLARAPRVSADSLLVYLLKIDPYPTTPDSLSEIAGRPAGRSISASPPTATLRVEACPDMAAVCGPPTGTADA